MNVAIIPARGGSKRIPRKNLRDFCGKPIIAYSIETALASGLFERVIVSTDDDEVAEIAERFGAQVPFRRPPELANDTAIIVDVIRHAYDWLVENDRRPDAVCCIYPTAPLMRAEDLKRGLAAVRGEATSALAVTTFAYPIQRALSIDADGVVKMLNPEFSTTRSQDLPEVVHDAGQFVWWRSDAVVGKDTRRVGIQIPRYRVQDVDIEEDWHHAERLFRVDMAQSS